MLKRLVLLSTAMIFACSPVEGDELERLRAEVRQSELTAAKAQCALARARARLAQAEGKRDIAVTEFRKVVAYYEDERQRVLAWLRVVDTDPGAVIDAADSDIAQARADLAEAEQKPDLWIRELQKIVNLKERKLQRYQKLVDRRAIMPGEVTAVRAELEAARKCLDAARKSLKTHLDRER